MKNFRILMSIVPLSFVVFFSDAFKLAFFSRPSAWLASFICGARAPRPEPDGYALFCFGQNVLINASCAGSVFFGIAFASFFFILSKKSESAKSMAALFVLAGLLAYPLTIFANACRIFTASLSLAATSEFLPQNYFAIMHMTIGLICFFTLLSLSIIFLNRHIYANNDNK